MPSHTAKTAARNNFLRKFTGKLYRSERGRLECRGSGRSFENRSKPRRSSFHLRNLNKLSPTITIGSMSNPEATRRWPRVPVDMPVRVMTSKGFSTTVVEGRGTELSEGGMVLYAGILLNPGDLLEIEFETPTPSRLTAIVRSRNGFCFGLEFITPLPS